MRPGEMQMWTSYNSDFGSGSDNPHPQSRKTLEVITQLVVPVLSLVLAGVTALSGKPGAIVRNFILGALAFSVLGFAPAALSRMRIWFERRKDRHVARVWFPKFQTFVRRFGSFVNNGTNDTLHAIIRGTVSDAVRIELVLRLGPAPLDLWYHLWYFFWQRVERQRPSFSELQYDVQEFQNLAGQYFNLCVAPIFTNLPDEVRKKLTEQEKGTLNGFQQRHAHFITEYTVFLDELVKARPSLQHLPRFLSQANPL
jgi:hypothetical protein